MKHQPVRQGQTTTPGTTCSTLFDECVGSLTLLYSMGTRRTRIFLINVWVPEVGNTADTPNPPWILPLFKGNLGVPKGQINFDLGGVGTHELRIRSTDASRSG